MDNFEMFAISVASGAVRAGTPVLFAATGELLTEKAGVLNLGLEGVMLAGALSAVVVSYHTGSPTLGVAASLLAGATLGLVHAFVCFSLRSNQIAAGIAITILGGGITAFLGMPYVGKQILPITPYLLPILHKIPYLGPVFFSHDLLVYVSYLLVAVMAFVLYRTKFCLAVQAVGDAPHSADAAGIRVGVIRYAATVIGAAFAGMGGAYISLVYAQGWIENMTTGRGLIAVGLVIFAGWRPWRALVGAYLFGAAISLQLRLQAAGSEVSPYLLGMMPFLLVIFVLVITSMRIDKKRSAVPAALGKPYVRQM